MGRPSNLSEAKWAELLSRLAKGEKPAVLAKEFGTSTPAISRRFSEVKKHREKISTVANQLLTAESSLKSLSVSEQTEVLQLKARLQNTSLNLAAAADFGSAVSHRLTAIAATTVQKIDDAAPLDSLAELKAVSALLRVANEASHIPLNLLAANKDRVQRINDESERMGADGKPKRHKLATDPVEASRQYREIMG